MKLNILRRWLWEIELKIFDELDWDCLTKETRQYFINCGVDEYDFNAVMWKIYEDLVEEKA